MSEPKWTTEEELMRHKMQPLARRIKAELPNQNWGFILLAFPFGPSGNLLYVANAHRDDVVQAMREFIAKTTNRTYATDQGTEGESAFNDWWQTELGRVEGQCPTDWASVRQLAYDALVAGMVWSV
jgi:hypothetical protein